MTNLTRLWSRSFHFTLILIIGLIESAVITPGAHAVLFAFTGKLPRPYAVSGVRHLQFNLYAEAAGGLPIAGPLTNRSAVLNRGQFTVMLDFGETALADGGRWVEVSVARPRTPDTFTLVTNRLPLTTVPFAAYALVGEGPKGDKGDPGAQGPIGPQGLTGAARPSWTGGFSGSKGRQRRSR